MSRVLQRMPGGDGALHHFAHRPPTQALSHLRDPHEMRIMPQRDVEPISVASYFAPEQRFLRFVIQTGDAIDLGEHRLCFDLRLPSSTTTTNYTAVTPTPLASDGTDLRPLAAYFAEPYFLPRLEHAVQLFERLVVRDATGAAIVDASDFGAYLSLRRWLESDRELPVIDSAHGGSPSVQHTVFNTYETMNRPRDQQAIFSEEGLRVCMRIDHPFFNYGNPILLRPQELTIELYLADHTRAFTTQTPAAHDASTRALYPGYDTTVRAYSDITSIAPYASKLNADIATAAQRRAITGARFVYELMNARFYVRAGTLSDEMRTRVLPELANGIARSGVDYLVQKSIHARGQLDFELRLRERLTNLRRTFIAPFWTSNLSRLAAASFDTTAAAISRFDMVIRGQRFPRFGALETQREIYEYVISPLCVGQQPNTRLTPELFMGSNCWLTGLAVGLPSATDWWLAPYGVWYAPRAFMLAHAFQPDAHELQDFRSLERAGGLSVAFEDPVIFRITRSTGVASWPASIDMTRASGILYGRSAISTSLWRTAQNQRGSFLHASENYGVTRAGAASQTVYAGATADAYNSSISTDTLELWLYAEYTTRITEYAGGRFTVER